MKFRDYKYNGPNGTVESTESTGIRIWSARGKLLYKSTAAPVKELDAEAFNFAVDGVRLPPDHWIAAE